MGEIAPGKVCGGLYEVVARAGSDPATGKDLWEVKCLACKRTLFAKPATLRSQDAPGAPVLCAPAHGREVRDAGAEGKKKWHGNTGLLVSHKGECLPLSEWARRYGIKELTLRDRWKKGWRGEKLFAKIPEERRRTAEANRGRREKVLENLRECGKAPSDGAGLVPFKGKLLSLFRWAQKLKIAYPTLKERYEQGLRGRELFAK